MKILKYVLVLAMATVLLAAVGCGSDSTVTPVVQANNPTVLKVAEAASSYQTVISSAQQSGIWVNGQGKMAVAPDLASLSMGVVAQALTVAEARTQAAEAMEKVEKTLKANGVEEKDIQTTSFNIYPVSKYDRETEREVQLGFRVSNMVTAKLRDLDKIGSIIDQVAEAGGDFIRIQGLNFTIDDASAYLAQVREKAFDDARTKAEQLAKLAGVTLGPATYITESSGNIPRVNVSVMAEKAFAAPAADTSISPGEQDISVSVQMGYSIQ